MEPEEDGDWTEGRRGDSIETEGRRRESIETGDEDGFTPSEEEPYLAESGSLTSGCSTLHDAVTVSSLPFFDLSLPSSDDQKSSSLMQIYLLGCFSRMGKKTSLKPTNAFKESAKKKKSGCWYLLGCVFVGFLACLAGYIHYYHDSRNTYPAKLQTAMCLPDGPSPFFVHCKDRESHNKNVLQNIVESASLFDDESIVKASVNLFLSLSMRTQDKELADALTEYLGRLYKNRLRCIRLVTISDFDEGTPRRICAEAVYRSGADTKFSPMELLMFSNDLLFLSAMYGSEFHEGSMRLTKDGQLKYDGNAVTVPFYSGSVHSYYAHSNADYSILINKLLVVPRPSALSVGLGTAALAIELQESLAAMRRCNPPEGITWMEYHSRSVFKRHSYKGTEDECGWMNAEDSHWDLLQLMYYDFNFKIRRLMWKDE